VTHPLVCLIKVTEKNTYEKHISFQSSHDNRESAPQVSNTWLLLGLASLLLTPFNKPRV
jgi:hypothetical protein